MPLIVTQGYGSALLIVQGYSPSQSPSGGAAVSSVEVGVAGQLLANSGIVAMLGGKVYPNKAPRGTGYPYIVYHRSATEPVYTMSGRLAEGKVSIELECCDVTYVGAKALALSVLTALDGFMGRLGPRLLRVGAILMDDNEDDYTAPAHADDTGVHCVRLMVSVWS